MFAASRAARLITAAALAMLAAYVVIWSQVSSLDIGRSDFTSTYVGGTLIRTGNTSRLYDETAQSPLHHRLIAPDTEGNLPFVDAPVAAAIAAPVSWLDLQAAYRLWSLVQLIVLLLAVLIAVRAAPWRRGTPRTAKVAAAALALAGAGTLVELMQAQWAPVTALGIAFAYREWRAGNDAAGAALLVICAGIAKPHLAIGMLAFMLGWRNRRVIVGALGGAAVIAAANLAVAGPAGITQFVQLAIASNTRWELRTFIGVVGIPGTFLGNSGNAQVIGAAGSVGALACAVWLGTLVARRRDTLDMAMAGAAVLSLLAAPHAGIHDLVMLAPVFAWTVAVLMQSAFRVRVAVTVWIALSVAAFVSLGDGGVFPPGQLTPWALVAAALLIGVVCATDSREHRLTSRAHEAPVGSLAHDVPQQQRRRAGGLLPLQRRGG